MENLTTTAENIIKTIQGFAWGMVAIATITIGMMFILGSHETKDKAKKMIPWVLGGVVLVLGAIELANLLVEKIAF